MHGVGGTGISLRKQAKREADAQRAREQKRSDHTACMAPKEGQMVLHMKRRLKAEREEMERAAMIQMHIDAETLKS